MRIIKVASSLIVWDEEGLGSVPNLSEVNYLGFVKDINIQDFRKIVPSGVANEDTIPFLTSQYEKLQRGETEGFEKPEYVKFIKDGKMHLAPPFIHVEWNEEKRAWIVNGHEGRSRTDFASQLGMRCPLHIFTRHDQGWKIKGHDLTEEQKNAGFIPEGTNGKGEIVYL